MKNFCVQIMESVKKFTFLDYTFLKLSLIFIGILLGTYFYEFFLNFLTTVWVVAVFSTLVVMYRSFSNFD